MRTQSLTLALLWSILLMACQQEEVIAPAAEALPEEVVFIEPKGMLKRVLVYNDAHTFDNPQAFNPTRFADYLYDQDTNLVQEDYYEYPDLRYAYMKKEYDELKRVYKEQVLAYKAPNIYTSQSFISSSYAGSRLDKKTIYSISDGTPEDTTVSYYEKYQYDAEGNMIRRYWEETQEEAALQQAHDSFIYKDGKLSIEYNYLNSNQPPTRVFEYEYNAKGLLVKKHIVDGISNNFEEEGDGQFIQGVYMEYFYDSSDKLIKTTRYNPYFGYGIDEITLYEYH